MSNLDVMLFSGYELEELKRMYPDCMDLLKLVDIFDIKDDGEVFFIGIPPKEFYEKFLIKIGGIKNEWKEGIRS